MDRIIEVKVRGHRLTKDSKYAGVQGEANVTALRIEFDEGWDGFAKTVTFWNALGLNPVKRILTADLLEDITQSTRIYIVPIPGEPMEHEGEMSFVIDGAVDGKRQRAVKDVLKVEEAPMADDAGESVDPTPTQAEQLQQQIDTLLGDITEQAQLAQNSANAAETAKSAAETAAGQASDSAESAFDDAKAAARSEESAKNAQLEAEKAQSAAEKARDEAKQIAGGDFASPEYVDSKAAAAESNAKAYTDKQIEAIPTPNVSGQIGAHNTDAEAHADIRQAVQAAQNSANGKETAGTAASAVSAHNDDNTAHADIRQLVANTSSVKVYTGTIGTTWTENEDTGVKSQSVAIAGVLAKHTAKVDHLYTGNGTADGYAQFVEEENQYLTYITNGYAETYDGGVTFYIFGDAPTVAIPIVVEVA